MTPLPHLVELRLTYAGLGVARPIATCEVTSPKQADAEIAAMLRHAAEEIEHGDGYRRLARDVRDKL